MHESDPLFVSVRIDVADDVMDGLRHAVHALQVDPLRERHVAILQSQLSYFNSPFLVGTAKLVTSKLWRVAEQTII